MSLGTRIVALTRFRRRLSFPLPCPCVLAPRAPARASPCLAEPRCVARLRLLRLGSLVPSPSQVVREGHYWRVLSAAFSHLDLMHLLFNMSSLLSLGQVMEAAMGSVYYLRVTVLLIAASTAITLGMTHVLIHRMGRTEYEERNAVGYSCVVFGWMAIHALIGAEHSVAVPFLGIEVPVVLTPFLSLFVTQIIVRRASFMGHLAGIVAGYAIGVGLFAWLTPYWLLTGLLFVSVPLLASVKATTSFTLPWVQVGDVGAAAADGRARTVIQNGVLRREVRPRVEDDPGGMV